MSPEVLTRGQVSFASDVYAFGITLWELLTSSQPFKGTATVSLGHNIAVLGCRPLWPEEKACIHGLENLANRCWASDPGDRPSMEKVLAELVEIRKRMGGETPPIDLAMHLRRRQEREERRDLNCTFEITSGAYQLNTATSIY